jgi:hypothetical protein
VDPAHDQDWLDEDTRRRRRMAERMAAELAHTPGGRAGAGSEYVASRAVQVRLTSAVEAQAALREAPTVISMGPSEDVGQVSGSGGLVMYVHGGYFDDWSIVFPLVPFTGLVLVCADDLEDHCMQVYDDSAEARQAISDLYTGVVLALKNRGEAIAEGWLPPEPEPLQHPA